MNTKLLIVIIMLFIGMNSCSKWLENEELTLPKTPYTGNELRTDGYYYYTMNGEYFRTITFFYKNGEYYLSEVNPRFGGAYLHAYGAGVDFIKLIDRNLRGLENEVQIGDYEEGVVMMMYDSVVIKKNGELAK